MALLERKPYDEEFYREELFDFLPDTFIDFHAHIRKNEFFLKPRHESNTGTCHGGGAGAFL